MTDEARVIRWGLILSAFAAWIAFAVTLCLTVHLAVGTGAALVIALGVLARIKRDETEMQNRRHELALNEQRRAAGPANQRASLRVAEPPSIEH